MLENVTRASFEPHLNSGFQILLEQVGSVDVELVEATDKTPAGADGEQFSLIFRGPVEPQLPQGIYVIDHPDMGRLDIFLVPVGHEKSGRLYEAFFNRASRSEK